ncbi:transposable element Tcb1 transposase [Trichonephila clavipes]|nr:transposable element Tcb1 transposase [Trichonephila clavipes]
MISVCGLALLDETRQQVSLECKGQKRTPKLKKLTKHRGESINSLLVVPSEGIQTTFILARFLAGLARRTRAISCINVLLLKVGYTTILDTSNSSYLKGSFVVDTSCSPNRTFKVATRTDPKPCACASAKREAVGFYFSRRAVGFWGLARERSGVTENNWAPARRHLDAFTRGRIIGKLEEGLSVTSEFGIAHSIVSRLWRQFQTTGTAIWGFNSGRPRRITPADDRYIVLQARRNRRQRAGEIARHTTQATGRPISRFTVARRLHGGGLFARRPVRCVPLTPAHRRRRSLWCREHRHEWGRVLFTDESRFSL